MSLKETTVLSRNDDFMEDVKLVAQNEQIAKVTEDFEACGTMGSEYIKGKYTLQKGDVSILLGELEFIKGETNDKKLEYYTIGDQDIIVYYQHVDCASINVHFVLFDGTSLKKMKIYYPSVNMYEDSFAASDTLYKGNFSKD